MTIKTPAPSLDSIMNFLHSRNPDLGEIDAEIDLIDNRIIDSLDFVEIIFLIEQATGQPIDLEEISVDKLRTLKAIEENYFKG